MAAGIAGGLSSTTMFYPLELVKTRMQVAESSLTPYSSLTTAIKTILREEGLRGFYKGLLPAIIAATGSWGGYFYFYESAKIRILSSRQGSTTLGVADHVSRYIFPRIHIDMR